MAEQTKHPEYLASLNLLVKRLTQERDEARAALAAAEEAARAMANKLEREYHDHGHTVDQRDEMEEALSTAHLALGGDGEWSCKIPMPPPPESGDLCLDVPALAAMVKDERDALLQFKAYVHRRLDEAGVPADPNSPHKAEGCRIGGRLDLVLGHYDKMREADAAREWVSVAEKPQAHYVETLVVLNESCLLESGPLVAHHRRRDRRDHHALA